MAEVEQGEGPEVEGIHLGFDAPRAPGGVDGSLCGFDTGGEVGVPVQIQRLGVQGPRQLLGRGVAGVLDGEPDRLLLTDRVPVAGDGANAE